MYIVPLGLPIVKDTLFPFNRFKVVDIKWLHDLFINNLLTFLFKLFIILSFRLWWFHHTLSTDTFQTTLNQLESLGLFIVDMFIGNSYGEMCYLKPFFEVHLILILRHYILIASLIKIQEFKRFLNSVLNCTLSRCNTLALPAQDFYSCLWSAILQILLISIPNTDIVERERSTEQVSTGWAENLLLGAYENTAVWSRWRSYHSFVSLLSRSSHLFLNVWGRLWCCWIYMCLETVNVATSQWFL